MNSDTALQVTILVVAIATVGLIASEVWTNLQRERARDREAAEQPGVGKGEPFADVLNPPASPEDQPPTG